MNTNSELLTRIEQFLEEFIDSYHYYDDPNGPYRCWYCSEPQGKDHTDDCLVTQAYALFRETNMVDHEHEHEH